MYIRLRGHCGAWGHGRSMMNVDLFLYTFPPPLGTLGMWALSLG